MSCVEIHLRTTRPRVPEALLLADLRRVAALLTCEQLSQTQYGNRGRYSFTTFCRRFGSWKAALGLAGLQPAHFMNVSKEALIADMQRVARELQTNRLRANQYYVRGQYSRKIVDRLFGRWQTAAEAAGFVPVIQRPQDLAELLENLKEVWIKLGRQPRYEEMKPPLSRFGAMTYAYRFGSYGRAVEIFCQAHDGEFTLETRQRTVPIPAAKGVEFKTHRTARTINTRLRYMTMRRDHYRCRACGRSPATDHAVCLQVDHITPWSAGGETVLENLQTLCEQCNGGKLDLD